ncbi:solute carrier family 46 member 3-like [Oppia nitens]|uniref:solute carrier family 46 member 3-like n=1 Tax=Oppia nitens TaxID=1686743 RepID=UPI0023DAB2F0|nr:solute carrier family 46 member 3-like [Oppia nitens]
MSFLQVSLKNTPKSQLIQDKICYLWYNQTAQYCYDLPTHDTTGAQHDYKSLILADAAQFATYETYINTPLALLWALFVGAWIDRYIRGRKILMFVSVATAMLDNILTIFLSLNFKLSVYYNLLTYIPTALMGGNLASRIAITHYMTSTTPPKLMAIRFMIYEMVIFIASPIGTSLGGYILVQKPLFSQMGELRNTALCFIIAAGLELLALLWIVFMVDESVARKQEIHPLRLLFNFENVKLMVRTCIKKRPNNGRLQVFLIFLSLIIYFMTFQGTVSLNLQFVEKAYLWGPDYNAYITSINMIIKTLATLSIVPFMIKVLKISDIPLALIGYCSYFAYNMIKGTFIMPIAYYVAMPVSAISGIASIGCRSHLTKIVGRHEIGKVLSFMQALDTIAPVISTTALTYMFRYTMDDYPGIVYQLISGLILIPICVMIWIDLFTDRPELDELRHVYQCLQFFQKQRLSITLISSIFMLLLQSLQFLN